MIVKDQFQIGDSVIIKTELGTDLGKIIKIEEKGEKVEETEISPSEVPSKTEEANFILRKAYPDDIEKWKQRNQNKEQAIKKCEVLVKKGKLPMKIVDVLFAFDGGKITFAFIALNRVDFRGLVKDLVQEFHKSVRMYQIGVRQEAGWAGGIGPCGRGLCCSSFLGKLGNVSVDMMLDQQLFQRGSERLTGICGRLKCCLSYEEEMYKELIKKLPPIGSKVKTKKGKGKVVDWHILKQTIVIEETGQGEEKGTRAEVPLAEVKLLGH